ncbi:MAG: nodulation protein NfeD [Nitrospirae bacterium]|nr:nodulation protein NfeD [Nitrospirota bacterium]
MGRKLLSCILPVLLLAAAGAASMALAESQGKRVLAVRVDGVINPVSSEFIVKSLARAREMAAEALVIELDTPGGLDTSMRSIVRAVRGSDIPVVVFVSPSGGRAASAGAFIVLSSHIAAMAPGTNIGAAHPVSVGQKMDSTMSEKATNDAAAYIRALAEQTGRNAAWAEDAVRKSISATENEALNMQVIDLVSRDMHTLMKDIDGRNVSTVSGQRVLRTSDAVLVFEEMGLRHKLLNFISDPSVAYMLMLLGFYGIFFELTNPGTIFPGVTGSIFLVLAFYAFQTLPVNYAGLLLIILAIILFILEVKVVSHGLLTVGGVVAMVMGSLMLFDSSAPFYALSISVISIAVTVTAVFFLVTFGLAYKAYRRKPTTGIEGLAGMEGRAATDITGAGGMVAVRGEIWSAYSEEIIHKGDAVLVAEVSGLKIKVRKKEAVS